MLNFDLDDDIDIVRYLDNKLDSAISELLQQRERNYYTLEDLDKAVNSSGETLREYIRDSEDEFGLSKKDLTKITTKKLNSYVNYLDSLWN
jgi:protein associated with RNAse G/E